MYFTGGDRVRSKVDDGFVSLNQTGTVVGVGPVIGDFGVILGDPLVDGCKVAWDNQTRSWVPEDTIEAL